MDYIPLTKKNKELMLKEVGVNNLLELFSDIPDELLLSSGLNLPKALSEMEVKQEIAKIASKNKHRVSFLGGGIYNHYVPSTVNAVISRSEFYTAYTPYQPEISQGTLRAIFEYQSMICTLTGMDISNASMYDGATSLAEAMIMSTRIKRRKKIILSGAVNPNYRQVLKTYAHANSIDIVEVGIKSGKTDIDIINKNLDDTAAVIIQSPNFFGQIEDLATIRDSAKDSLLITSTTESLSWALLKPFFSYGVDIVTGEGQSFGLGMNFGGPLLGIMAIKSEYSRQIPGRLIGKTKDTDGKDGFVLTLCTREQHIRREKATSNICSNEGLCALSASVYLATIGPKLKDLAELNNKLAIYFAQEISKIEGFSIVFDGAFFNEFVVKVDPIKKPRIKKLDLGISLEKYYPQLKNCYLVCCTEMTPKNMIDKVLEELK